LRQRIIFAGKHIEVPDIIWGCAAALIVLFLFIPSVNYPFLLEWDDVHYLFNGKMVISIDNLRHWLTGTTQKLYSPVTMYSLMIDGWLFGKHQMGYHVHSLLLHCGSVLLLYLLLRHFKVSCLIAGFIALLWGIHPQRVPSVVWLSERKDILAIFFALAAMLAFVKSCDKKRFSLLAPLLLLLSLGAKPAAIGLPVVMLIYLLFRHKDLKVLRFLVLPLCVTVFYLCCFFYMQPNIVNMAIDFNFLRTLIVVSHNIMWYFINGMIPFELNPVYPKVSGSLTGNAMLVVVFILFCSLFVIGLLLIKKMTSKVKISLVVAMALSWGALFLPISGIWEIGSTDYCDRYNYLISVIPWILIALILECFRRQKSLKLMKAAGVAALILLGGYWYLNWTYQPVWSSCDSLFVRSVQWQYPNAKAVENLGWTAVNKDNPDLAELAASKFLNLAAASDQLELPPKLIHREVWQCSGMFLGAYALFLRGDIKEALPVFVQLGRLAENGRLKFYDKFNYPRKMWGALASCYLKMGNAQQALECLKKQLAILPPNSFDALFNQGLASFIQRDFAGAEKCWAAAIVLRPGDQKLIYNLKAVKKLRRQ
jgi:tetratricopeptide (TPR) repeat protein